MESEKTPLAVLQGKTEAKRRRYNRPRITYLIRSPVRHVVECCVGPVLGAEINCLASTPEKNIADSSDLKAGNAGKWKTPHHQAKQLDLLQPGDKGIWVTCARQQEAKATREIIMVFAEVSSRLRYLENLVR